jgi:hypothetical protein
VLYIVNIHALGPQPLASTSSTTSTALPVPVESMPTPGKTTSNRKPKPVWWDQVNCHPSEDMHLKAEEDPRVCAPPLPPFIQQYLTSPCSGVLAVTMVAVHSSTLIGSSASCVPGSSVLTTMVSAQDVSLCLPEPRTGFAQSVKLLGTRAVYHPTTQTSGPCIIHPT